MSSKGRLENDSEYNYDRPISIYIKPYSSHWS